MTEEEAVDSVRERAADALERADELIAEPRPHAGAGENWSRGVPLAEPVTTKRAPAAAIVHKTKMQEPASPAPSEGSKPVRTDVFELVLRGLVDGERRHVREQIQPLLDRVAALESRLARAEGRVAGLEAKKGKK